MNLLRQRLLVLQIGETISTGKSRRLSLQQIVVCLCRSSVQMPDVLRPVEHELVRHWLRHMLVYRLDYISEHVALLVRGNLVVPHFDVANVRFAEEVKEVRMYAVPLRRHWLWRYSRQSATTKHELRAKW